MKIASISDTEPAGDYAVGYGKPPRHAGFQKGRSGNPKGRPKGSKNLATLVAQALDEKVIVTEDGRRRRVTKRELVVTQLVDKSAAADLRAIKQLTDIVQSAERRSEGSAAAPSEPAQLTAPDREVVEFFVARLRRQIAAEAAEAAAAAAREDGIGLAPD
jgi:Family of unknown function (DUF5681)